MLIAVCLDEPMVPAAQPSGRPMFGSLNEKHNGACLGVHGTLNTPTLPLWDNLVSNVDTAMVVCREHQQGAMSMSLLMTVVCFIPERQSEGNSEIDRFIDVVINRPSRLCDYASRASPNVSSFQDENAQLTTLRRSCRGRPRQSTAT